MVTYMYRLQAKGATKQLLSKLKSSPLIPHGYLARFGVVRKVVGKSHSFNQQIDISLRHFILLLNEDVEARDIRGFMITSNGNSRKLLFPGKVIYCGRSHNKHTFHKGCPSEQRDEEQQPPTEQNKNIEQQNLTEVTQEAHQDAENSSKRNEVGQNHAAPGQSTALEGGAEAMPGDISKLQSNHLAASNKIQQQGNAMVKEGGGGKKTAAGNQQEESPTVISLATIEIQRLNTRKYLMDNPTVIPLTPVKTRRLNTGRSHGMCKKGSGTPTVIQTRKKTWEDSNRVPKRGRRHGLLICTTVF